MPSKLVLIGSVDEILSLWQAGLVVDPTGAPWRDYDEWRKNVVEESKNNTRTIVGRYLHKAYVLVEE